MVPATDAPLDLRIFALVAHPPIAMDDRTEFLRAVRRALMAQSRLTDGSIPRLFSGHERDGTPARSGQHEHVFLAGADLDRDQCLDTLIVAAPWRCDQSLHSATGDAARFDRAISSLEIVRAGRLGVISLQVEATNTGEAMLIGPASVWESHTRYCATRPARTGNDPADILRHDVITECHRRGLLKPALEVVECAAAASGFITGCLRLTFAIAVRGPILLGRDSHKGGGLFVSTR
jgi:CRISPR-associated protein Csb2